MRLATLVAVLCAACTPGSEGLPEEIERHTPLGVLNLDKYEGEPSNTYVLTIGVNDYSHYDRSLGQEVGTSDLEGAVNDAQLWWLMSNAIGVPIPRIRMLSTPSLADAPWEVGRGAEGSSLGNATRDEILKGLGWLTSSLAKDPTAGGLLTFSGHGLHLDGGLALAPADLEGESLGNAIPYADIAKLFEEAGVASQVTVVLDTCQAADPTNDPSRTGRALVGHEAPAGEVAELPRTRERILTAADLGQPSYEAYLGGKAHGAFSWSMVILTERWEISREDDRSLSTVSYGELTRRTGLLLDVLGLDQTPRLFGQPGVEALPFLSVGAKSAVATDDDPNRRIDGPKQLDPGLGHFLPYLLKDGSDTIGVVAVVGSDGFSVGGSSYAAETEYWTVDVEALEGLGVGDSFKLVKGQDVDCGSDHICSTSGGSPECGAVCQSTLDGSIVSTTGAQHVFTLGQVATWSAYSGTPNGDRHFEDDSGSRYLVMDLDTTNHEITKLHWLKSFAADTYNDAAKAADDEIGFIRRGTSNGDYPLSSWTRFTQSP